MKNWKIAFFVSLSMLVIVIVGAAYIVLANTLTAGHCHDNLQIIAGDVSNISKVIKSNATTIDDFEKALDEIDVSYSAEDRTIRLQLVKIVFDNEGYFETIEF